MASRNQQKLESFEALLKIARAMSIEKDIDRLLVLILDSTTQVLHTERSTLFLYDADQDQLFTKIAQKEDREIRIKADIGIAGAAAKERRIINVPDAYADPRFNREIDRKTGYKTRNILAAPLVTHEDKLVGILEALNKIGEPAFSKDDELLLEAFASHVAISLDNNMLIQHYLEKKKMKHALELARQIQQNLLPRTLPDFPGLDIGSLFVTCDQTGGDYFDYFTADGNLFTIIGDVTGHGIGPALMMAETRAVIRAISESSATLTPDSILSIANKLLAGDMIEGRFVTLFLGIFDRERRFSFSSAGHGNVYHLSGSRKAVEEFEPTGIPLGIFPDSEFERMGPLAIRKGDVILFTTDGVDESTNPSGEEFGKERLFSSFMKHAGLAAGEIIRIVHGDLLSFAAGMPQKDDITMLAVKAK